MHPLKVNFAIDPLPWPLRPLPPGTVPAPMTPYEHWRHQQLEARIGLVFEEAVQRWRYVLRGWPDSGPQALDVEVHFGVIDGAGPIAATGRPIHASLPAPGFPTRGEIRIDVEEIDALARAPDAFFDIVLHELGHVFGLGTDWERSTPALVRQDAGGNWEYVGAHGVQAFTRLACPGGQRRGVPVSADLSAGQRAFHWDEDVLGLEIMSTMLTQASTAPGAGSNVISAITVGALADLGYVTEPRAAQPLPRPCLPWSPQRLSTTAPRGSRLRCRCG